MVKGLSIVFLLNFFKSKNRLCIVILPLGVACFSYVVLLFIILYRVNIGLLAKFSHKMLEYKNQWVNGFYAGSDGHKLGFTPITGLYSKYCARIKK